MKITYYLLVAIVLYSCGKAESLCEFPVEPVSFFPIKENNDPKSGVSVKLKFSDIISLDEKKDYVVYSIPEEIINPSNNDRGLHVTQSYELYLRLKDTANPPARVTISAYTFNDCGESAKVYGEITYDTIP